MIQESGLSNSCPKIALSMRLRSVSINH
jgi:hypothetical protein